MSVHIYELFAAKQLRPSVALVEDEAHISELSAGQRLRTSVSLVEKAADNLAFPADKAVQNIALGFLACYITAVQVYCNCNGGRGNYLLTVPCGVHILSCCENNHLHLWCTVGLHFEALKDRMRSI